MSYYRLAKNSTKTNKSRKRLIIVLVIVLVVVLLFCYFYHIRKIAVEYANAEVYSLTANAVNDAVYSVMSQLSPSHNLVTVKYDSQGDVVLLQANSAVIGKVAKDTSSVVEERLVAMSQLGVSIPVGTLSGITFLIGSGPNVSFDLEPIGSVVCVVYSKFESVGINQTLHKIYLDVTTKVEVIIPRRSSTVTLQTPVLLSESLIVGKIPDTYLNGKIWGSN